MALLSLFLVELGVLISIMKSYGLLVFFRWGTFTILFTPSCCSFFGVKSALLASLIEAALAAIASATGFYTNTNYYSPFLLDLSFVAFCNSLF